MADGADRPSCGKCKFWRFTDDAGPLSTDEDRFGYCLRYAPRPYQSFEDLPANQIHTVRCVQWPSVTAEEWCGDFASMVEAGNASPA